MGKQASDKDIAAQARASFEKDTIKKSDILTEIISLPSKGYFYPLDHPLATGEIELKYPTAREEDILTSRGLIQKGIVLDRFMESIIVSDVDYNSILLGDKNGIMVASRILAYGIDYKIEYVCPQCSTRNKGIEIDLSEVETKDIEFEKYDKGQQEFEVEIKDMRGNAKHKVKFKLLTHADIKKIDEETKALKKKAIIKEDREMTTRLKHAIVEVDGNRDRPFITNFTETLLSRNSFTIRQAIQKVSPDIDLEFDFECNECGYADSVPIPIEVSFFWPSGRL